MLKLLACPFSKPFHLRRAYCLRKFSTCPSIRSSKTAQVESHQPAKTKVIFSGIQPTGTPHLGNYLGALRQWVQLQQDADPETELIYCIVDLHAITTQQDRDQLRRWKRETMGMLLALGLDPTRSTIFYQSDVPAHCELMWILSCSASTGYLSRMTQWKSKLSLPEDSLLLDQDTKSQLKLGLFSYPVLQAADILVHGATHVPVGVDQAQHLEFARTCATGLNHLYGTQLPVPETILSPAKRVMSLREPHLKMSKSHNDPRSRILLTDSANVIQDKIKVALTDSLPGLTYDPIQRPGLSNLIEIMSYLSDDGTTCEEVAAQHADSSLRSFKTVVADTLNERLKGIRQKYEDVMSASGDSRSGSSRAPGLCDDTLSERGNPTPSNLHHTTWRFHNPDFTSLQTPSADFARFNPDTESGNYLCLGKTRLSVDSIAQYGAEKARQSAAETMYLIKDKIGI